MVHAGKLRSLGSKATAKDVEKRFASGYLL